MTAAILIYCFNLSRLKHVRHMH